MRQEVLIPSRAFPSNVQIIREVLCWIRGELEPVSLTRREKLFLEVALEEAIVNVILYAKSSDFCLEIIHERAEEIAFILIDKGIPFNPLTAQETFPKEIKPTLGGRGLTLIRKCTDAILYRRENDTNILTLIKKISPSSTL